MFRFATRLGLQVMREIHRLLRFGGGGKYRAFAAFQNLDPERGIGGVIGARLIGKSEIGAQKRRAQFGNEFFGGIGFITQLPFWVAVKACFSARPVRDFAG